jgi:hypothetical protein
MPIAVSRRLSFSSLLIALLLEALPDLNKHRVLLWPQHFAEGACQCDSAYMLSKSWRSLGMFFNQFIKAFVHTAINLSSSSYSH